MKLISSFTLALSVLFAWPALAAKPGETLTPPDFTKGGRPDESHDWTLGPTGARGWIFTSRGHSRDARQILVTKIASGSPADGVLAVGDVILGVNAEPFADDARVLFAKAITAAEAKTGALRLLRWRAGKTDTVELKLAVLGGYSATAPYDCAKSGRVFELGCASLAKRMADEKNYTKQLNPIPRALNALALLASGDKEHLPLVKREAQWAADFTTDGYLSWYYGFLMMFVSEYVMATGDTSVMPGLTRLALETARGQSGVGTWGHRFATSGGNLSGYGAMNAPGLPLTIGMVLAREAGVSHPDLDRAITKASGFLRWFVHKGAVPYGDHLPFPAHEDNGKCAAATVLFDLLGDREAAEFFAKMAAAAYSERERGHTGNYFNILWAMQGVARCGSLTTGAYWQEQSWYYDLARTWDAAWVYQGSPVGAEEHGAYKGWDTSGSHLLDYALPLKSLRLTGRKAFAMPPLDATQTAAVIAAGRDFAFKDDANRYEQRTSEQLLAGLASWSPFVRKRSAEALGKRQGDFVPALLKLLASTDRDTRYGAVEALGALGQRADAAAPQLRAALKDADPWLQSLAAEAIPTLGPAARKASVSDLLAMTVRTNPADPRRLAARSASVALFANYPGQRGPRSILADSLDGVDRAQLYPAIRALLQHEDSIPRGSVSKALDRLTDADLVELLPDIAKAIERIAPSNEMFGDGIRLAGLDLLSRLHIREGMALCLSVMEPERWGEKNRSHACLTALQRYGTHAKAMLPKLQVVREQLVTARRSKEHLAEFDKAVAAIQSSTETPTLVDLRAFQARAVN
ncbi:MAG TPA: acetylesterase [Verrucomicrobiales bacterium]|nr:acetylesterase [Verrucomicrobiales bacterium]